MTSQQFLVCDSSTLANFKSWAQAISTFMGTIGWTQTADTGQVNWSTIASVPTAGTFVYEIWEPSSDPLQTGSTAYYLKIQYGQTSQTPPGIRIALQAGTGTNGSGTLTGLTTAVDDPLGNGAVGGGSVGYECDFSGDAERVSICMFRTTPTGTLPFYFSVERTKNTDGSNSSDGVTLLNAANSAGTNQGLQVIVFGQAVTAATGRVLPILSGSNSADQFLNSIPAGPGEPGSAEGMGHGQLPIDLLRPYEADDMKMGPVNQKVGNVRNNGPEMLNSA
jgi:hypothetical protein